LRREELPGFSHFPEQLRRVGGRSVRERGAGEFLLLEVRRQHRLIVLPAGGEGDEATEEASDGVDLSGQDLIPPRRFGMPRHPDVTIPSVDVVRGGMTKTKQFRFGQKSSEKPPAARHVRFLPS